MTKHVQEPKPLDKSRFSLWEKKETPEPTVSTAKAPTLPPKRLAGDRRALWEKREVPEPIISAPNIPAPLPLQQTNAAFSAWKERVGPPLTVTQETKKPVDVIERPATPAPELKKTVQDFIRSKSAYEELKEGFYKKQMKQWIALEEEKQDALTFKEVIETELKTAKETWRALHKQFPDIAGELLFASWCQPGTRQSIIEEIAQKFDKKRAENPVLDAEVTRISEKIDIAKEELVDTLEKVKMIEDRIAYVESEIVDTTNEMSDLETQLKPAERRTLPPKASHTQHVQLKTAEDPKRNAGKPWESRVFFKTAPGELSPYYVNAQQTTYREGCEPFEKLYANKEATIPWTRRTASKETPLLESSLKNH